VEEKRSVCEIVNDFVKAIKKVCSAIKGLRLFYLFGSYAEGRIMPISDVDVAVVVDDSRVLMELRAAIAKALGISKEKISVFDLTKMSPVMKVKVLKHGIRVIGSDVEVENLLKNMDPSVVEVIDLERGDFYRWLNSVDPIDESIIKSVITQVEGDIGYLRKVLNKRNISEVIESDDLRRAFERAVHTAIEGSLDLLRHIISGLNLGIAEYYRDYVDIARKSEIISKRNAEKLSMLVDLRHGLVHRYRGLDYEELWNHAKTLINLWTNMLEEVRRFLKAKLG
jgi:uncharacterized protein YutE (UPF0331/DUF86 family)/predicted nucleotidyltransferase